MKFNWKDIFISDLHWSLAAEIMMRTLIMFIVILVFLRLSGKKGVRQLSLFEVAIIIGLGSAAGDPMFNPDNAILPALIVFASILLFYRFITWLASKNEWFEKVLEGEPVYVITDGEFVLDSNEPSFAKDEFFAEMRQKNLEHVGQVKTAILETNGQISFFYYPDEEVKAGLPILPKLYHKKSKAATPGKNACTFCAHVVESVTDDGKCPRCHNEEWVAAICTTRLT
jgi:uncharacterized membrane protein YcaP (DUF421 family)